MACNRGQANPDRHTVQRLFADSAGYCQRPECGERLFIDTGSKNVHIAEMAHIIAASGQGPRGNSVITPGDRGAYENLILLCSNCHTMIDKAPADFPAAMIREWKRKHIERVNSLFGVVEYSNRAATRQAIEPALAENYAVFNKYGPDNDYRQDPESEVARVWQRKMRAIILPNNRKIISILDANHRHLDKSEQKIVEDFRQHVDDLEAKHIGEGSGDIASRFPSGMSGLLKDNDK